MHQLGFINDAQFQTAVEAPLSAELHRAAVELQAPYIAEMVRADVVVALDIVVTLELPVPTAHVWKREPADRAHVA